MGFDFDQLLDASIDGVPFFVSRGRRSGGRRTVTHEFPGSEGVRGEDVGRLPRRFQLEAFVIGDNYLIERDELLEVLEKSGPKLLVHPLYGEQVVDIAGEYQTDEDTSEAITRISVPLVEHGTKTAPRELLSSVPVAASGAINLAQERFSADFDPAAFLDELLSGIRRVTSTMRRARGKIEAALSIVEQFSAAIDEFEQELADLLATPTSVASRLTSLFGSMYSLVGTVDDAAEESSSPPAARVALQVSESFETFENPTADATTVDTPRRKQRDKNMLAVQTLVRTVNAVKLSETVATVDFSNADDALEARSRIQSVFEDLTSDDDLPADNYEALEEVRATTARYLSQRAQRLPQVMTYEVPVDIPAVVLAWRLYGDAERWKEISDRNALGDPLRISGGEEVEVILA